MNVEEKSAVSKIRYLQCAVCGSGTRGRQWPNRDTGYGLCSDCVPWLQKRGIPADEMRRNYGIAGTHYNVEGA